jgi:phospholipid/cholesterol/gamma-HCH transport system substrate-binding protein
MSRSLSRWQALLLGLIVLSASGLAAAGLFAVGSKGWYGKDALHVRVGFPEIRGVEVGTRVRIQGMDAGEVVRIDPPDGPHQPVLVRLRIKNEYRHLVRVSSTVQIVSEGMLGGKVLEVRPPPLVSGRIAPDMSLAEEDAVLACERSADLPDVLAQMSATLEGVQNGEGTLGKLAKDPEAYKALVSLLRNGNDAVEKSKDTMASIQRDADAIKKVPWIGGYVDDPVALLVRPTAEKHRRLFAESDLFEPGRAVLTAAGQKKLDELIPWLEGLKHKGSDVVVVSYADPRKSDARPSVAVTKQQSEAVVEYLRKNGAHRMGWFSSRKVTSLGQGTTLPPQTERESLPPARVEVVVFVPQT